MFGRLTSWLIAQKTLRPLFYEWVPADSTKHPCSRHRNQNRTFEETKMSIRYDRARGAPTRLGEETAHVSSRHLIHPAGSIRASEAEGEAVGPR